MAIKKRIRKFVSRFKKKEEKVVVKVLPPKITPPVRAVDIGTKEKARVGGITIRGEPVRRGNGRRAITPTEIKKAIPKPIVVPVKKLVVVKAPTRAEIERKRTQEILRRKAKTKFDVLKFRKETGFFVLEEKKKREGLEASRQKLIEKQTKLLTDIQRGKGGLKTELGLVQTQLRKMLIETQLSVKEIGKIIKDPERRKLIVETIKEKDLKTIGKDIKESGKQFGKTLRITPTLAITSIAGELLLLKGSGKVLKVTGKLTSQGRTIISPKFRGLKEGKIIVPSVQKGKTLTLEIAGVVKKLGEPLKKQVKIAGKKVTAVSVQADKIVSLLKTKRVVRKPIPNEEFLSKKTKKMLERFDQRRITKKQLIELDRRIKRETKGVGSLLERSFFADPRGRLRPSRLGVEPKEASLLDILSGDVSFRTNKPQVLVFEDIQVQKFPKNLKTVEDKLKKGKTLTEAEARKLLKFQVKTSGKFKPIGALSKEPEITLAPGEIIKKVKTIAVTLINGRRVPIVRATVIKAKPETRKLLSKLKKGNINPKEIKKLRLNLKKETGFKSSISRPAKVRPRVSLRRALVSVGVSRVPRIKRKKDHIFGLEVGRQKKVRGKPIPRKPIRVPGRKGRVVPSKRIVRVARRPVRQKKIIRGGGRLIRGPAVPLKPLKRIIAPPRLKKKLVKRVKPVRRKSYQVLARPLKKRKGQTKPKLIKVNKVPLTKKRARDLRNFIVDTSLARTSKIKPTRGKPVSPKLIVPKGYARKTSHKFRTYRQVKKKRIPLPRGKVIERSRNLLDTRQEKKQITLKRRIAQISKPKQLKRLKTKKR